MLLQTELLDENKQIVKDGEGIYDGHRLVGWYRGQELDDHGAVIVNIELAQGGGLRQVGVREFMRWNSVSAMSRGNGAAPEEVASDPEAVAYHQAINRKKDAQLNIIERLLELGNINGPVVELVREAMKDDADDCDLELASNALNILCRRHNLDDEIPF